MAEGCSNWQTTAQMFSSLFEKPKMSEKLLSKPPFKYIFDIITETTKVKQNLKKMFKQATGFAQGLYNDEEQNAQFYESKERKLTYLKKMIDLTQLMLKEEIVARPNKIVAGLEPDNTNIFLQAIYRAAVSLENSQPFVKKILAKYASEDAGQGEQEATSQPTKEEKPEKQQTKKQEQEPKKNEQPQQQQQKQEKQEKQEKNNADKPDDKKLQQQKLEAQKKKEREIQQQKLLQQQQEEEEQQQQQQLLLQQQQKAKEEQQKAKEEQQKAREEQQRAKEEQQKTKEEQQKASKKKVKKAEDDEEQHIQQLQQQQQAQKAKQQQELEQQQQKPKLQRPESSKRPIANKSSVKVEEKNNKAPTGVIMDGGEIEEDQGNQQIQQQPQKKTEIDMANRGKFIQDAMKDDGGLEQQNQQGQQNAEEEDDGQGGPKIKMGRLGKKKGKKQEKDSGNQNVGGVVVGDKASNYANISSTTDVDVLTKLVQQICQNANPLGKSLEFIQDDIESMNHELDYWQKQYKASKDKMQNELKITEENLQPLQDKLTEIQQQIFDQKSKISNMKGQILKNQSTIQTLLYSVVASK